MEKTEVLNHCQVSLDPLPVIRESMFMVLEQLHGLGDCSKMPRLSSCAGGLLPAIMLSMPLPLRQTQLSLMSLHSRSNIRERILPLVPLKFTTLFGRFSSLTQSQRARNDAGICVRTSLGPCICTGPRKETNVGVRLADRTEQCGLPGCLWGSGRRKGHSGAG